MIIKKYFLPNFISLSSIMCGFISLYLASLNEIKFAAIMILLGGFLDSIDGKIARALKATNKMGKEIDSLADMTTFGMATGFLIYQGSLYHFGILGLLVAAFIPMFSAIRLARFNVKPTKGYFEGVPTTWTGTSIAILQGFYYNLFSPYFYLFYTIVISFLMISKFTYYKPNLNFFNKLSNKLILLSTVIAFFLFNVPIGFLIPIFWYPISGILYTIQEHQLENMETFKVKF